MSIVGLGKEEMKMRFKRICAVALCALVLVLSSSAAYAQNGGADHEPNAVRSGMAVKSGVVVEVLASQAVAAVQKDPDIRKVDRVYVTLGQGTRIIKAGI